MNPEENTATEIPEQATDNQGSVWRKWDLHIHAPFTNLNNGYSIAGSGTGGGSNSDDLWRQYCQALEDSDVAVFGITDYFSLDGYKDFVNQHQRFHPQSTKTFFPNIELRLSYSINNETQNVHCHILFNNDDETLRRAERLINELPTTQTDTRGTHINCAQLSGQQYQSATVDLKELKQCLEKIFGTKSKPYLVILQGNGYGSNRASGSQRNLHLSDEIDKFADLFFGTKDNVDYYLKTDRYEDTSLKSVPKAVLSYSDCHSFDDLSQNLGKNFSWIKADTNFDGLSQILFLPNPGDRTIIKETAPVQPVTKISNVALDVSDDAKIRSVNADTGKYEVKPFFFAGKKWNFNLSPYFNCFVGGRGVGKSTLLNLIDERLASNNGFFRDNTAVDFEIANAITVDDGEEKYVEFFGQNEIEQYAKDAASLTKTVYARVQNGASDDVGIGEDALKKQLDTISELIDLTLQQHELTTSIDQLKKDLGAKQNMQKVVQSEDYKKYSVQVKEIREKKALVEQADQNLKELLSQLSAINESSTAFTDEELNHLGEQAALLTQYNDIIKKVSAIQQELQQLVQTSDPAESVKGFDTQLQKIYAGIQNYLSGLGYSAENIKDMRNAVSEIQAIEKQLKLKTDQLERINQRIQAYSYDTLDQTLASYEANIKGALEPIQKTLSAFADSNQHHVATISIDYVPHDTELVKQSIESEFKEYFAAKLTGVSRSDMIKEALFKIEPAAILDGSKSQDELLQELDNLTATYARAIHQVLTDKNNFDAYNLIIKKNFSNPMKHQRFSIKYDGKPLDQLSFGQRCTAAIILILSTGNKPIIIDEPEAHLDSGLIADTLVDLIKVQKSNRQIIFATHNANFVINADAEKIFILEDAESGVLITETTIENTKNRGKLMRLEGGKEALDKRFHRYNIVTT